MMISDIIKFFFSKIVQLSNTIPCITLPKSIRQTDTQHQTNAKVHTHFYVLKQHAIVFKANSKMLHEIICMVRTWKV